MATSLVSEKMLPYMTPSLSSNLLLPTILESQRYGAQLPHGPLFYPQFQSGMPYNPLLNTFYPKLNLEEMRLAQKKYKQNVNALRSHTDPQYLFDKLYQRADESVPIVNKTGAPLGNYTNIKGTLDKYPPPPKMTIITDVSS